MPPPGNTRELDGIQDRLNDHAKRIKDLEIMAAKTGTKLVLITAGAAAIMSGIVSLAVGLFILYMKGS